MDVTVKRGYRLPPLMWAILTAELCLAPCPFITWLSVASPLGTEANMISLAFCLNECSPSMLAGGHELTGWGPWVSHLASLERGVMTLSRIQKEGNNPSTAFVSWPLWSFYPHPPAAYPAYLLPCPQTLLMVLCPWTSSLASESFFNILTFIDLQIPAYLPRLGSNVISHLSLFIHSICRHLSSKALCYTYRLGLQIRQTKPQLSRCWRLSGRGCKYTSKWTTECHVVISAMERPEKVGRGSCFPREPFLTKTCWVRRNQPSEGQGSSCTNMLVLLEEQKSCYGWNRLAREKRYEKRWERSRVRSSDLILSKLEERGELRFCVGDSAAGSVQRGWDRTEKERRGKEQEAQLGGFCSSPRGRGWPRMATVGHWEIYGEGAVIGALLTDWIWGQKKKKKTY